MSLLYRSLRRLIDLALDFYFVDIQVRGRSNIPDEGPVIFAANHPNSIMDTLILGTQTEREISYMARSGLFDNPLVAFIFNRTGVIPVYKNPGEGGSNEDAFQRAYEVLADGGSIGIFPEGRNSEEREVLEIKTGTARIALNAARTYDYELPVKIVPTGLSYQNRDEFLSSVLVRFGEPIEILDFAELHRSDEREAVRVLTERIGDRLRDAASHIEGRRVLDLVRDIHEIYGRHLMEKVIEDRESEKREASFVFDDLREGEIGDEALVEDLLESDERRWRDRLFDQVRATIEPKTDLEKQFWLKQRIAKSVAYYEANHPDLVQSMQSRVWRYKDHLRQVRLKSEFFDRPPETLSFRMEALKFTLYALAFFLPAAWGFIHNFVPYNLSKVAARQPKHEAQRAFAALLTGVLVFPLIYTAIAIGIWFWTGSEWATSLYVASLPVTGFFFFRYRRQLGRYRSRILLRTLFQTESKLLENLQREREELLASFDELRENFLEWEEGQEAATTGPSYDTTNAP